MQAAIVLAMMLIAAPAGARSAPADEYFGPLKMSPLQIRSRIGLLGRRYRSHEIHDRDVMHDAVLIELAYRAWRNKYRDDPWLAPTAYHLEQLYALVPSAEARDHALTMLHYVTDNFPKSKEAHESRVRLAAMETSRPRVQPAPSASVAPAPNTSPSAAPSSAEPSPTPPAPASPAPSATP